MMIRLINRPEFQVSFNEATSAIILNSGQSYTAVGGEMSSMGLGNKTATPTTSKIYLDGKEVQFTAYNIDGNNYFRLRDVGETFNFGIDWDGVNNTIAIDTAKDYNGQTSIVIKEEANNSIKSMFDASTFTVHRNMGWTKYTDTTNFPNNAKDFTYAYRCVDLESGGWGGWRATLGVTNPQNSMSFTLARSDSVSNNTVTFTITDLDNDTIIYQVDILSNQLIEVVDLNIKDMTNIQIHAKGSTPTSAKTPATLFVLNPTVK